jgi:hypothetical protein
MKVDGSALSIQNRLNTPVVPSKIPNYLRRKGTTTALSNVVSDDYVLASDVLNNKIDEYYNMLSPDLSETQSTA